MEQPIQLCCWTDTQFPISDASAIPVAWICTRILSEANKSESSFNQNSNRRLCGYFCPQLWLAENWTSAEKFKIPESEMNKTPAVSELSQQYPSPVPSDSGNIRVQHKNCEDWIGTWQRISKMGTTGCLGTAVLLLIRIREVLYAHFAN